MSIFLGIDLGSTTTKAILLDEDEKNEARVNARFTLLRRSLESAGVNLDMVRGLEDHFQTAAFHFRLDRLRGLAMDSAAGHDDASRLSEAIGAIFQHLDKQFTDDAGTAARLRKSFFRDIAGAAFMTRAETDAQAFALDFEDLMAVYDEVVLVEENSIMDLAFAETLLQAPVLLDASPDLRRELEKDIHDVMATSLDAENMVGTGYGRQRLPFKPEQIRSEILCHGLGAHYFFPATRTVLDIGGQDTKAIQIDENGVATNFQMNDRCAAGCGRYLGYIADELNISLDDLGPLALKSTRKVSVSSTCTVFAGAEIRERLELGERREDILAGLHRAIVLRAVSIIARSGGINDEFTFTGGVARNPAVVAAMSEMITENYGQRTLNIHPDSIYTGAVGAALYAHRETPVAVLSTETSS